MSSGVEVEMSRFLGLAFYLGNEVTCRGASDIM